MAAAAESTFTADDAASRLANIGLSDPQQKPSAGNANSLFENTFNNENADEEPENDGDDQQSLDDEEYANTQVTMRALVSTKEAGVIIGKQGKNVSELRELLGVKAGVSKVVQGVHDRVLTIVGTLEGVAKAYAHIAKTLLEQPPNPSAVSLKLLISHQLMGTIIGRAGTRIKLIQDQSGCRMTAAKEMLPQSTERVVEIQGTPDAVNIAVWQVGKCLIDDWERAAGTVLYNPIPRSNGGHNLSNSYSGGNFGPSAPRRTGNGSDFVPRSEPREPRRRSSGEESGDVRTQNISIPGDMVGCIIGKGGSKISDIRNKSGSRISIAKTPHDATGERMFTITGTPENTQRALYLLYEQLEEEKARV
ncbi:RNA-binding protein rnc1 [Neolecta irregularis DAH-3]|uniref:RNA-binding protein rnc1 n=1 Tax=Neolecta irregularis (strain DAH-3) TaxID=1198029 RepID=A0A1U7LUY1_NEOID|nr:RNA-binding protein rnc1 [Neolecta irregularis DAH-3]|eukprot:OLL26480.1 RNA-binding protein rnc1 [Neolecta irregularis DAH-3]